jgi:mRNA-degrading endonuclease YafQ of YafQ-DinJ toxin-antitoxin module
MPTVLYRFILHKRTNPERYNAKDATMYPAIPGVMHCHLAHGKVILIYRISNESLELLRIVEHNDIELRGSGVVRLRKEIARLNQDDMSGWVMQSPQALN